MAIYEVAFLLGRTVQEIRDEMPFRELQGWFEYFERRPVGWREDQRTSMLLNAWGAKVSPEKLFPSLAAISKHQTKNSFKGSLLEQLAAGAVGGDKIGL